MTPSNLNGWSQRHSRVGHWLLGALVATYCLLGLVRVWAAQPALVPARAPISLDGTWDFATDPDRVGEKEAWFRPSAVWPVMPRLGYSSNATGSIQVPGIWDHQGYGTETPKVRHNFVGLGWYRRVIPLPSTWAGRRVFLYIGGVHRYAKIWVNGHFLGEHIGYLSEFEFDVTDFTPAGTSAAIVIQVDSQQRYEIDTLFGTADLADYMDVVWGGIWGHVRLETRASTWLSDLFVQPNLNASNCTASAVLQGESTHARSLRLEILDRHGRVVAHEDRHLDAPVVVGTTVAATIAIPRVEPWSPDHPALYHARLTLLGAGEVLDTVETRFGMRDLRIDGSKVMLNGKRLFLRGYGDDHIYPEQMALPVDKEVHLQRLRLIKSYGFNHVRHHSAIMPPEYYDACDEVGIMPTAEFPIAYDSFLPAGENWKQRVPPGTDPAPAWATYSREWAAAMKRHRNHPSIFAWVMGNELWGGIPLRHEFRRLARELDPSRPFADTDGVTESGQRIFDPQHDRDTLDVHFLMFDVFRNPLDLPDKFNTPKPRKPIISHESGNYVTFTRPDAADAFQHNIKPFWMTDGRAKLQRLGLLDEAPQWAAKSERLYLALHKSNLEALRQNPFISGYHWWLFQDYWTTANGLVDHYFKPKAITADEVRRFNSDVVLLQEGLDLTYRGGSALNVKLRVSNFAPDAFKAGEGSLQLLADGRAIAQSQSQAVSVGQGEMAEVTQLKLTLPEVKLPTRLQLRAEFHGSIAPHSSQNSSLWQNDWTAWLYPKSVSVPASSVPIFASAAQLKRWPELRLTPIPETSALPSRAVYLMGRLDRRVLAAVENGGSLVLLQGGRVFNSRPVTYRSTWWKAGDDLNANQCGTFVYDHPVTRRMAPDGWCDPGWFNLLEGARKIGLENFPSRPQVIIRALPSLQAVQDEALLFEVGLGAGSLIVSGLNHDLGKGRPENDWLLHQLLAHAATLPRLEAQWAITALPPLAEAMSAAWSGFQKLLRNEGEEGVWHTYREDNLKMPICRQTQPGNLIEWETSIPPVAVSAGTNGSVRFVFAGGLGFESQAKTGGFVFLVNGLEQIRFDLPEQTNRWHSADGGVELKFITLRSLPQDHLGLFQVTLPRSLVTPGQPCRFGVRSLGENSRRWFALHLYPDANEAE